MNGDLSSDKRFSINGQSKSAMVQVGKETELNIVVYRGQDYLSGSATTKTSLASSLRSARGKGACTR